MIVIVDPLCHINIVHQQLFFVVIFSIITISISAMEQKSCHKMRFSKVPNQVIKLLTKYAYLYSFFEPFEWISFEDKQKGKLWET